MSPMRTEIHWQREMRCYADRHPTVDAAFRAAVAGAPDATAVAEGDVRHSYAALDRLVDGLAGSLVADGVMQGDRVAVFLNNGIAAVVAVLAVTRLGAVLVPVGARLRKPELAYVLDDAEPVALIYDDALSDELPDDPQTPRLRIRVGGSADPFAERCSSGLPPATAQVGEDDLFGILYTSGTTGRPKGALLSHLGVIHSALHWHDVLRLGPREISVLAIPWSHVAGLCGVVIPILHGGGTLVLMCNFARRDFLHLAEQERMTHALLVPAMYNLCLREPDLASFDLSCWRLGVYGSAPMPEPTIRRFAEAVPHLTMCNAYGATETTSPATIMPPGSGVLRMDSIGRTVPCGAIRVVDEAGQDVPPGEAGELWIAGPMIVPGYWRNAQATAAGFQGGYWRSGDIGSVDEAGFVRIADRKKDVINRGGFKIYPAEIESVLCDQAGVIEAALVGQPDPVLGERAVAFVQTAGALLAQDVRAFCAERMADYKVPDWVVVSPAPLPRNANGKIQKAELRTMAERFVATAGRPKSLRPARHD